ncbi:MAG: hypothetical protein ACT4PO_08095 [Actinomycetota bacterium]
MLTAYQRAISDRLEEGLRAIQQTGVVLMQEIAGEVWRTAGGSKDGVQAHILESLSRDQAIRGMIAHSDERFQALTARTARLEDTLMTIAETTRALKAVLSDGVKAIQEAADSPALQGVEDVRLRLTEIERHLAATFERLDERDQILVGSLRQQVQEHGSLVQQETGRIVEALEGYVRDGVGAMGHLAQRIEQQTELMYERVGIETRALTDALSSHESWVLRTVEASSSRIEESLDGQVTKIGDATREIAKELTTALEARMYTVAELGRSDSEAIRRELVDAAAAQNAEMARTLDDRLERVSAALTAATRWTVEEMSRRIGDDTFNALQGRFDDAVSVIDRNMIRVADTLDTELDRLGQRTAQAADAAIESRFGETIVRLDAAIESTDRASARIESATEAAVARGIEGQIGALARMIRSDNRILAERLEVLADQESAKQTLRAVKELQASLPSEIMDSVDRRFAALADALSKSGDALGQKVDRIASRLGESYERDMQSVIERMGDAMHALASLGRGQPTRVDLE